MAISVTPKDFGGPHFIVPSLNCSIVRDDDVRKDLVTEYYPLPYECSLPIPFGDPTVLNELHFCGFDRVTELVNDKQVWEACKTEILNQCLRFSGNHVVKTKSKRVKKVYHGTFKLAEHLQLDPDPEFSGFYNWYFSDGCIDTLYHANKNYILFSNSTVPGTCLVRPVDFETCEFVPMKKSVSISTGRMQSIFQVCSNNNLIAVRQKNAITLFSLVNDEKLKFKKIHSNCDFKESFVNTSICDDLNGEYCTLSTSHTLKIWSPESTNECISYAQIKDSCKNSNCDHWGCVKYLTNNNLLVSTRSTVYLKDTRIGLNKNVQKWKTNLDKLNCDILSLVIRDISRSDCAFLGTSHHLYELDFRKGLSKQWTHMMEYPPMYGVMVPTQTSNSILIGSQNVNEICLIDSNLHTLPYILPAPNASLAKANSHGICIDPTVSSRFNFSMVGFTAFADNNIDNKMFVFRMNSVDDIFYQNIIHKDDNTPEFASECNFKFGTLAKWQDKCLKAFDSQERNALNVTMNKDFNTLFIKINKRRNSKGLDINNYSKESCTSINKTFSKIKCKNNFSQGLLSVWGIKDIKSLKTNYDEELDINTKDVIITEESCAVHTDNINDVPSTSNDVRVTGQLDLDVQDTHDNQTFTNYFESDKSNQMLNIDYLNEFDDNYYTSFTTPNKTKPLTKKTKSRVNSGF